MVPGSHPLAENPPFGGRGPVTHVPPARDFRRRCILPSSQLAKSLFLPEPDPTPLCNTELPPSPPPKSSHGFVWLAFVLGSGPTAQPPGKGNCSPVLVCPSPHGRRLGIPGPAVNPPPLFLSDQRCCGLNTQAPSYTIAGPRQGAWAVPMALVWQQLVGGSRMRRDQQTHTIFRVFSLAVWAVVCRCYGVDFLAAVWITSVMILLLPKRLPQRSNS